jgi:TnpA family transposase
MTDTGAYTDVIFGIFSLLGYARPRRAQERQLSFIHQR